MKWELSDGHARSEGLPGVRVRGSPFPGTIGVAPSPQLMRTLRDREAELESRVGLDLSAFSPPPIPVLAADGLGTLPPREIGGNLDVRHLTAGSRVFFPVHTPGALVSLGDMHFAQGEGEMCGSAIETGAEITLRFDVARSPSWIPRFPAFESISESPRRYVATSGIPVTDDGANEFMDVGLAACRALLEMIDYLTSTYGFQREAAYVLASVVGELRVSQIVDLRTRWYHSFCRSTSSITTEARHKRRRAHAPHPVRAQRFSSRSLSLGAWMFPSGRSNPVITAGMPLRVSAGARGSEPPVLTSRGATPTAR